MPRRVPNRALIGPFAASLLLGACAGRHPAPVAARPPAASAPSTSASPAATKPAPSAPARLTTPSELNLIGRPLSTHKTVYCIADPANAEPSHRQYCDKHKRRFYYFDPVKREYFWDNGQPKI